MISVGSRAGSKGRMPSRIGKRAFDRARVLPAAVIDFPLTVGLLMGTVAECRSRGTGAWTSGRPVHAATITRCVQTLDRAGLPSVRFHDLRHTAATLLLAQGMTLEDVKQQLGHSTIVLTSNTY